MKLETTIRSEEKGDERMRNEMAWRRGKGLKSLQTVRESKRKGGIRERTTTNNPLTTTTKPLTHLVF